MRYCEIGVKTIANGAGIVNSFGFTSGRLTDFSQPYQNFGYLDLDGVNDRVIGNWNASYDNLTSFDWSVNHFYHWMYNFRWNKSIWTV